jgi:hypothetical protein
MSNTSIFPLTGSFFFWYPSIETALLIPLFSWSQLKSIRVYPGCLILYSNSTEFGTSSGINLDNETITIANAYGYIEEIS